MLKRTQLIDLVSQLPLPSLSQDNESHQPQLEKHEKWPKIH